MGLGDGVAGETHVEEDAPILQHRRRGMGRQVGFDGQNQFGGRRRILPGKSHCLDYQPIRLRRFAMCAVWWRLCQS